uniref:Enoyl reductase (ER) domain-containing protein n=1 Tax=Leersia perrieri TaxID=77586 RepID=A0A0D9XFC0_9ORYZ
MLQVRPRRAWSVADTYWSEYLISRAMAGTTASRRTMMRAVQYDKYGGGAQGLKHVEVPIPKPKKGEVLIKMEAASINQVDWKFQSGIARPFMPKKFPFIPVCELSGEVVELGSGVSGFKVGDKVIANSFPDGGGLAEYAVAKASRTAPRPPDVSAADGACLPIAAVTALVALRTAGLSLDFAAGAGEPKKNVLVTAASGGVGHFAAQLAALAGAHVTATCGARNLSLATDILAADEAIDYASPDGAAVRSPSGRLYDAVVHCAPAPVPWKVFDRVLAGGGGAVGVVVDLTPGAAAFATAARQRVTFARKRLVPLIVSPAREEMEVVAGLVAEGKIKAVIDSRYPLSRAEEGWAKSMAGHVTGKIVVEIGEDE